MPSYGTIDRIARGWVHGIGTPGLQISPGVWSHRILPVFDLALEPVFGLSHLHGHWSGGCFQFGNDLDDPKLLFGGAVGTGNFHGSIILLP